MVDLQAKANSLLKSRLRKISKVIEFVNLENETLQESYEEMVVEYIEARAKLNPFVYEKVNIHEFKSYTELINHFEVELAEVNQKYAISEFPAYRMAMDSFFVSKSVVRVLEKMIMNYHKYFIDIILKQIKEDVERADRMEVGKEEKTVVKVLSPGDLKKVFMKVDKLIELKKNIGQKIVHSHFGGIFTKLCEEDRLKLREYVNAQLGRAIFPDRQDEQEEKQEDGEVSSD